MYADASLLHPLYRFGPMLRRPRRERHLDLLQWGLLPHAAENPDSAFRPIHVRAEIKQTKQPIPRFCGFDSRHKHTRWRQP